MPTSNSYTLTTVEDAERTILLSVATFHGYLMAVFSTTPFLSSDPSDHDSPGAVPKSAADPFVSSANDIALLPTTWPGHPGDVGTTLSLGFAATNATTRSLIIYNCRIRPKHKKLLSRGLQLLFSLMVGIMLFEFLLKPSETVIAWMLLIALVIAGGVFFVIPLELTAQERLINRWYRAAHWAGWILCMLLGALFLRMAVIWGIEGLRLEQFAAGSSVLLITGMAVALVGIVVVGSLGVIGLIAQVTEETREEARQWASLRGRTTNAAGAGRTQEDTRHA